MKYLRLAVVLLTFGFGLISCGPNQSQSNSSTKTQQDAVNVQNYNQQQVDKDFAGVEMKVTDVSQRNIDGRQLLVARFSVPLNPSENHQDYFRLQRKMNDGYQSVDEGLWVIDSTGRTAYFNHTEPSTDYRVSISAGLKGGNKKVLSQHYQVDITTRELQSTVTFDTNGHFVAKGLSNGLPVRGVNIQAVNIDFFRIEPQQVSEFLTRISYDHYSWNTYRLTELGQLVYSARYDMSANNNQQFYRNIDVSSISQLQQSGVYLAVMSGAGVYNERDILWFSVTDLAMHVRHYAQSSATNDKQKYQMQVHISSLKTAKAKSGVKVTLYGHENKNGQRQQYVLASSQSDVNGLASFDHVGDEVKLIVAQSDGELTLLQQHKPQLDLSAFDIGSRPQLPLELFIYGPRDLYRPGEVIDFSALVRNGDGQLQQKPTLAAKILRPNGSVAHEFRFSADKQGYYHYNWSIPYNAPVGDWQLEIASVFQQPQIYPFKVEEFMPERMKLSINPNGQDPLVLADDQDFALPVLGEYLYGAPATGNRASAQVTIRHWRSPVKSLPQYEFGDLKNTAAFGRYDLEDIQLDGEGKGRFVSRYSMKANATPLKLRYTISLYESGGRPVTRNYDALMWPQEQLLGIAPRYAQAADHSGPEENSRVKFDLVKASVDGQLHDASNIEVNLIKEDKQYYWVHDTHRGWYYNYNEKEYIERSQTINLSSQGPTSVAFPVDYGNYRLEVIDSDKNLRSSYRFHAGSDWYASWQYANELGTAAAPDKVTLALDKGEYSEGEVAKLTLVAPQAGEALVMVEGAGHQGGVYWSKRVAVGDKAEQIEIPIDAQWQRHDMYITAMVVQSAHANSKADAITPKRSLGLIHLPISREQRRLDLSIDIADKLVPNQKVKAKVKVDNWQQGDAEPYISLAVVDVGVLNISDFKTPDPFKHFYGQRAYQVQMRDIYDQVIEVNDNANAKLRFGGDADLARGGEEPKADVQIVSMFNQPIATVNGVAEFDLPLPDFNGRLRLMALGFVDDQFGSDDKDVTVAAPVVAQLAMPRFIATGDKSTIALDLNNLTEQAQSLDIVLNVNGAVKLNSQGSQQLSLASKQKHTLSFDIEATEYIGHGDIALMVNGVEVDGQSVVINKSWRLGVRPAYGPEYISAQVALGKGESYRLNADKLSHLVPQTVQGRMSIANTVDLGLGEQLKHLIQYPYGCLEQTSARAYVLTYVDSESQKLMPVNQVEEQERQKMLKQGFDRIAGLQLANGGFGLWSNQSPEEHWLTVYVADFLLSAKQQGHNVPEEVLNQALSRLRQYLRTTNGFLNQRYSEDKTNYTFSYRAYAAYVLSRVNRASLSYLRRMYDKQLSQSQTLLPRVQLAIALIKMGDNRRGIQLMDKVTADFATFSRGGNYYGDYGSDLRDTAMMIHLMISNDIYPIGAGKMSLKLIELMRKKSWYSTNERNALFLAGLSLAKSSNKSWQGQLTIAEQNQVINTIGHHAVAFGWQDLASGIGFKAQSQDNVFIHSEIVGYSKKAPKPSANKMAIERRWYSIDGKPMNPDTVKVGDLVVVGLTVRAKQRSPDGLVIDKVPAGFEPENQNLNHGVKLADLTIEGKTLNHWMQNDKIKHREYRDDRFVAAVDLYKNREVQLFYLLRAVTPGVYGVPAPMVEDMYFPAWRAVGESRGPIKVTAVE